MLMTTTTMTSVDVLKLVTIKREQHAGRGGGRAAVDTS